jgi:hypothetical protein
LRRRQQAGEDIGEELRLALGVKPWERRHALDELYRALDRAVAEAIGADDH